ncbi:dCTP deaminase [Inquilinus sp. CA228]|uniref:dCTP deaminase n=1 Tax=Inquilinus sp. CA228 TaxID=3455609 RepID=UPI003F8D532B
MKIKIAISRGSIMIDPPPLENAFSSTSVDLTLDPIISEFKPKTAGIETSVDPASADFNGEAVLKELTIQRTIDENGYLLKPNYLVLAWTVEYVNLKYDARLAARVEGKSSLARLGLAVHMTAPTIHAGFEGRIRLEVVNHGLLPIRLRSGMRFCQLIFEQTLGTPERGYHGRFSGQTVVS